MREGIGLGWREEKVYQQIHNYKLLIYKGNQNISIKIWVWEAKAIKGPTGIAPWQVDRRLRLFLSPSLPGTIRETIIYHNCTSLTVSASFFFFQVQVWWLSLRFFSHNLRVLLFLPSMVIVVKIFLPQSRLTEIWEGEGGVGGLNTNWISPSN